MRGILFKPIRIPGLRRSNPSKPRSLRFKILVVAWSIALLLVLLGGISVTTYVVTFLWTISAEPTPKSIEELPLWMIPVCMLTPVLLVIATAWRFKLFERLLRSIKKENERDV